MEDSTVVNNLKLNTLITIKTQLFQKNRAELQGKLGIFSLNFFHDIV